jgi:hypothetical protein
MFSRRLTRFVAAGAAAVAVAIGGFAIGNSSSGNGASGMANEAHAAAPPKAAGPAQARSGQVPKNWRPGTGTLITGAAADKAKAAALANYPGTVNRVLKLGDGSYAVHMFANPSGPHHVFVSKNFKVTGTA